MSVSPIPWPINAEADNLRYQEGLPLNNPAPMVQAAFGLSIALNHGSVLVGAPHAMTRKGETGKAYLFDGYSGRLLHTFLPPHPMGDDLFGLAVGWAGDFVVIGSPQAQGLKGGRNGAVYLFRSDTGRLVRTIYSPGASAEIFGHAVAGRGEWVLIGDPGASIGRDFHVGAVYLFEANTGRVVHEFRAPESQQGDPDRFGHAVGFVGPWVVVAAPLGGDKPVDQGVVYLFDRSSGTLRHTLVSPHPQTQEYFGWGMSSDDHGLLIGAPGSQERNVSRGAAYLFTERGTFRHSLDLSGHYKDERFGEAVGLMSQHVIVSAPGRVRAGVEVGGIFVFNRAEGGFECLIENTAFPEGIEDAFGLSLNGSSNRLAVGSPFGGTGRAIDSGMVHQFQLLPPGMPKHSSERMCDDGGSYL